MCTNVTRAICPICNEYVDENKNRIIVELCGHSKCRLCFINEANGCTLCKREKDHIDVASNRPSETICNEEGVADVQLSLDNTDGFFATNDAYNFEIDGANNTVTPLDQLEIIGADDIILDAQSFVDGAGLPLKPIEIMNDIVLDENPLGIDNTAFALVPSIELKDDNGADIKTISPARLGSPSNTEDLPIDTTDSPHIEKPIEETTKSTDEPDTASGAGESVAPQSKKTSIVNYPNTSHIQKIKVKNSTSFKCLICQKQFKSRNNKKYHFYCDQKLKKPWECDLCDKTFITLFHYQYHMKTHSNSEWFACTQCDKKYMREISLKKHLKKHNNEFNFKCGQCDQRFVLREQLTAHENRHKNLRHKCPECKKSFWLKTNLTKHIATHSEQRPYKCKKCPKAFKRSSALNAHQLTHTEKRPFTCQTCEKSFLDQRGLDRHARTHKTELVAFECTLCSAQCSRRDNIRRHVRNIHANENIVEVLRTIFQRYSKKIKKTEQNAIDDDENDESGASVIVHNVTSVIRFAKSNTNALPVTGQSSASAEPKRSSARPSTDGSSNADMQLTDGDETPSDVSSKPPTPSDYASSPSQASNSPTPTPPTTVEQKPMNMHVYRQLLSPYLKPSAKWRNMANEELQNSTPENPNQKLDAPTNNVRKGANTIDANKPPRDQYAIYRRILRGSSE